MQTGEWTSRKLPVYCKHHGGKRIVGFIAGQACCQQCLENLAASQEMMEMLHFVYGEDLAGGEA